MRDPIFEPPEGMRFLNTDNGLVVWAEPSEKFPYLIAEIHVGKGTHCQWSKEARIEAFKGMIKACEVAIEREEASDEVSPGQN